MTSSPCHRMKNVGIIVVFFMFFALGYGSHAIRPWLMEKLISDSRKSTLQDDVTRPGRWRLAEIRKQHGTRSPDRAGVSESLRGLPYLAGSTAAPPSAGVIRYEKDTCSPGVNLVISGHAPEAILMTMKGEILHQWSCSMNSVWPNLRISEENLGHDHFWRTARLLDNGDLLAIFEGIGLIKLDRDSHLIWAFQGGCHHDLDLLEDGTIVVLTRTMRINPLFDPKNKILDESLVWLDSSGKTIRELSLISCFQNSDFSSVLNQCQRSGDILHTNSIRLLDGTGFERISAFKKGNILLSIRYLNALLVIDPLVEKVVWFLTGQWSEQHHPDVLESGNLLLFDNIGRHGKSRIIEFDPVSQEIAWRFPDTEESTFFSRTCGACQRLPNGNTLITESDRGRALEVNHDGEVVWEYVNPQHAGKDDRFIATLFDVIRLDPDSNPRVSRVRTSGEEP